MQVPETDIYWTYSLVKTSETKASARTGVPVGASHELVGIDGSNDGGLQPFPGFREVYRFTPEESADAEWAGAVNPYKNYGHKSSVRDFWSFSVLSGTSYRVFGYVYVAKRPNGGSWVNTYDLIMAYYSVQSGTEMWKTRLLRENVNGGVLADVTTKAVMSMETTGRMLYVFERGVAPVAVFFTYSASGGGTVTPVVNTSAGPGKRIGAAVYSGHFGNSSTHSTANFPDPTDGANPPGSVVFATAQGTTGNVSTISNLLTAPELAAGTYGLAVQFEDSRSGRKSQLCTNQELEFTGGVHRVFLDGIYDSSKFDTLNIYRSVRSQSASGAYTAGILQLEAQITIEPTYKVTSLPGVTTTGYGANFRLFRYAYQLKDSSLVMQDVFLDKPTYYETMPKGGAGILYDSTMLVGNISESAGDQTGTGETRWSSGGMESPELFTANSTYKPRSVGDAVMRFNRTGQIITGMTKTGIQMFSKDNGFIRVLAAHTGYGVVGPYAAATVGPVTYYLNSRGLKAIYPDARLDDVQAVDNLIQNTWYSESTGTQSLLKVSMSFDPATLVLYILNPTRQEAVQFWFSTGTVSELRDMSFDKTADGWWLDSDGQLVPRALFLSNSPYPDAVTDTNYRPALYMPSRGYNDKKTVEAGTDHSIFMLDGDSVHNPSGTATFSSSSYTYYNSTGGSVTTTAQKCTNLYDTKSASRYNLIGSWVYISQSATSGDIGLKARVVNVDGSYVYLDRVLSTSATAYTVLDPIFTRWVGGVMRVQDGKDEEFVVKQPSSMGCVFTDVDWTEANQPAYRRWKGLVYRENESDPVLTAYPTSTDGSIVAKSVIRGDSPVFAAFGKHGILNQWLFAGVETFLANVRFRLVGVQVKGRMLPTDRTRRTY
jgi:hypothetical protein